MGHRPASIIKLTCRLFRLPAVAFAVVVWCAGPSAVFAADKNTLLTEVHFDPGSAAITPGGQQKIQQAIAAIKKKSPREIRVIGFTDTTGDAAVNARISRMRADNVASMLAEQGVTVPLIVEGKGEEGGPYKIDDDVSEPLNRCVGIIAVGGPEAPEPML